MSDASRGPHAKEIKTAEGIGRDDPAIAIRGVMVRYDQEVGRLMLTIMGGIAEFERNLIRKRCEEGIEQAKRKGVTFGRKRKLDKEMVRVAAERGCGATR